MINTYGSESDVGAHSSPDDSSDRESDNDSFDMESVSQVRAGFKTNCEFIDLCFDTKKTQKTRGMSVADFPCNRYSLG